MLGDRSGARAVEPELLARLRADSDEAFADAGVRDADHFRGRSRHRFLVVANDIAEQGHLRQHAALGLGRIADRAQIALVQMLQAGEDSATLLRLSVEIVFDFDDGRNRIARLAEEFEADGACVFRHPVQDPARGSNQAVAALFLHARQAGEELVGHILAETLLAEALAFNFQVFGLERLVVLPLVGWMRPFELELRHRRIMDLAEVVLDARDFQPVAVRIDHAPAGEVV